MMRNVRWVALIVITLVMAGSVSGDFDSAKAQSKTRAAKSKSGNELSTLWDHGGSVVSLESKGANQKLFYVTPRIGLVDAGVKPGTLLFEGQKGDLAWFGTAYQFYRACKPQRYLVGGNTSEDRRQITLRGKAPLLDLKCNVAGSRDEVLIFTVSKSVPPSEPPEDKLAAAPPAATAVAQAPSSTGAAPNTAIAGADVPSAASETNRAPEIPIKEGDNAGAGPASAPGNAISASRAVPPNGPAKDHQPGAKPSGDGGNPKSEGAKTANDQTQQNAATPLSEPPKDTQVAALPGAAGGAIKTDDASKAKNSATTGEVAAPKNLTAASKSEISIVNDDKTAAVPTNATEKMMEIVLKNGRILRIGRDIDPEELFRIISLLDR